MARPKELPEELRKEHIRIQMRNYMRKYRKRLKEQSFSEILKNATPAPRSFSAANEGERQVV